MSCAKTKVRSIDCLRSKDFWNQPAEAHITVQVTEAQRGKVTKATVTQAVSFSASQHAASEPWSLPHFSPTTPHLQSENNHPRSRLPQGRAGMKTVTKCCPWLRACLYSSEFDEITSFGGGGAGRMQYHAKLAIAINPSRASRTGFLKGGRTGTSGRTFSPV